LQAANCTFNNVVKTTVLLADIGDFTKVNEIYKEFFTENYPARAAYQVN
jgi:2-iminobutanoate/2-iminopropanoate deaminase